MKAEKQNKWPGICASLGLHGLLLVVLMISLSGSAMIAREPGMLDLIWVSLDAKAPVAFRPIADNSPPRAARTAIQPGAKPDVGAGPKNVTEPTAVVQAVFLSGDGHSEAVLPGPRTSLSAANGYESAADGGGRAKASEGTPAFTDAYPLYRENPPPGYPEIARQLGYEGIVLISAEILANGRVGKTMVRRSSGYAILDQTAMEAVRDWKFEPAKKSGVPCKTWAELPIRFRLDHQESQS